MSTNCPTCGPTVTEQHPRLDDVLRCANCKEWLSANDSTPDPPVGERCCPGQGTMAHVRSCRHHPEHRNPATPPDPTAGECCQYAPKSGPCPAHDGPNDSTPASEGLTEAEREAVVTSVDADEPGLWTAIERIIADREAAAEAKARAEVPPITEDVCRRIRRYVDQYEGACWCGFDSEDFNDQIATLDHIVHSLVDDWQAFMTEAVRGGA